MRSDGAAVVAVCGGVAMAVQGRLNSQLAVILHDGLLAAVFNFASGFTLMLIGVLAFPGCRRGLGRLWAAVSVGRLRWWQCAGGVSGAIVVVGQGFAVNTLGLAVFTVTLVAAQVVSSLLVDRAGLGPAGRLPLTTSRVGGAAVAVIAVAITVIGLGGLPTGLWLIVLPAVGGATLAWQQAVNGRVREAANSAPVAALLNFGVGLLTLLVIATVDLVGRGVPRDVTVPWWALAGGACGIIAIGSAVLAVRTIGVLLLGLCSVTGQVIGSLVLDIFAPAMGHHVGIATVAGATITVVAVGITVVRSQNRSASSFAPGTGRGAASTGRAGSPEVRGAVPSTVTGSIIRSDGVNRPLGESWGQSQTHSHQCVSSCDRSSDEGTRPRSNRG